MYVLRLAIMVVFALVFLVFNPVYAAEVISLGACDEFTSNTRLEFNFKTQAPETLLPSEAVKTNVSRLADLRSRLLTRDFGPLTLGLNLNNLSFKLDVIESYQLFKQGSTARSQFVQDVHVLHDDIHSGLMFLRSPINGVAVSLL